MMTISKLSLILHVEQDALRILDAFLDTHEKGDRLAPVDDAVIVAQREIHHRPDLDFVADDDRTLVDLVHAEDGRLRRIEDRRRHQRTVNAAIGDGEGSAAELVKAELADARAPAKVAD